MYWLKQKHRGKFGNEMKRQGRKEESPLSEYTVKG